MTVKGFDQIRKHVPDLNTPLGVLRLFFPAILLLILLRALSTPLLFNWPIWQLVAEIVLGGLGFGLLALFIRYKAYFKSRFGPLAYSRAASWLGFPGVVMISSMIARIRYLPGPMMPRFWGVIVLPVLGWALIVIGALLGLRTVVAFGVDNLTMLYVYFPEESRLVNYKIYSIVRHPAYAAVLGITYGLALLDVSWLALASAFIFTLILWGWLRLVEEKELIQRFGHSYAEYRQRVPAFLPHLRDLAGLFEFMISGS
jgi:protein-S-isoprenylcysteine O-methyltransferase Ste14